MRIWILALFLFAFAMMIRLWDLGGMGRWWDEKGFMEKNYTIATLVKNNDFSNPFWYTKAADHPPLPNYFYTLVMQKDYISYENNATPLFTAWEKGAPVFQYDLSTSRLLSVIITSLTVVLVFLFGVRYFSLFTGVTSAIILAMLPHLLGYSQLVDLESWVIFFFTACVFFFVRFLETSSKKYLYLTGILTGMCFEIKQSNILIILFYVGAYVVYRKFAGKKIPSMRNIFPLILITIVTMFVIWPMPWVHPGEFLQYSYDLWFRDGGRIPELLFGIHMGAPFPYYIITFLVTTPALILLFLLFGLKETFDNRKKWLFLVLLLWFIVPFFMSFFHIRQHMVRYIIQVYVPTALLAAVGFEYILRKFSKNKIISYAAIVPLVLYLFTILYQYSPYYLEYYNELVGGVKNVYEKKLFFVGWFGEGLKAPGAYIAVHAKKGEKIGMALNPETTLLRSNDLLYETFNPKKEYDFVVVNTFNIMRNGFDDTVLNKDYKVVHVEEVAGAPLAKVYKHK